MDRSGSQGQLVADCLVVGDRDATGEKQSPISEGERRPVSWAVVRGAFHDEYRVAVHGFRNDCLANGTLLQDRRVDAEVSARDRSRDAVDNLYLRLLDVKSRV